MENNTKKILVARAVNNAEAGCSCSESISLAMGPALGLDKGTALKISTGLAGGMGLEGGVCGVVSACILAIGLAFGPEDMDQHKRRGKAMVMSAEFMEHFCRANGSTLCRELCPEFDIKTKEGANAARQSKRPLNLIKSGAQLLLELLGPEGVI